MRNPEEIARAIGKARTVAICSHVNPDGDTLGSALAMRLALLKTGREVSVFCQDKVPDNLTFLPGADTVRKEDAAAEHYDLLLALDISDEGRMGKCRLLKERCDDFVQIDHHPTNPGFARINSIDGNAAATCILIREQLKTLDIALDRDLAVCLYTGISTDTGNFAFSSTSAEVFSVMSELMECKLPLADLNRVLFREKPKAQLKLLGRAIESLRFSADGRLAVMKLSMRDFRECGALEEHADTIVNYGLDTTGTRMAMLARETAQPGVIKFNLRAVPPDTVSDVAVLFGGGGHPQAAGISMQGTLDEKAVEVAAALEKKLNG